jgi:uncharacterized Zn-binding protein involved in type VI secretion
MTTSQNTPRAGIVLAIVVLAVTVLAPAAGAAGQDELSGWERTATARTGNTNSGPVSEPGPVTSVQGLRGWEATTTATQPSARVANPTSGPESFPITTILLYVAAGLAAIIVALGVARMTRPNRRPPRVA